MDIGEGPSRVRVYNYGATGTVFAPPDAPTPGGSNSGGGSPPPWTYFPGCCCCWGGIIGGIVLLSNRATEEPSPMAITACAVASAVGLCFLCIACLKGNNE